MKSIWKTIQRDVQNKHWDTGGLKELFDKKLDVILTRESLSYDRNRDYCTIKRNGDIVVGFYLDDSIQTPMTLQMTIGGVSLSELEIKPGEFVYVFENTHVYPLLSVAYSELHLTTPTNDCNGLYVIYALINESHIRREIAMTPQILNLSSGKVACFRGCFGYLKIDDCDDAPNELPNMTSL
jgi:hypothetical protein